MPKSLANLAKLFGLLAASPVLIPMLVLVGISSTARTRTLLAGVVLGFADEASLLLDRKAWVSEVAANPSMAHSLLCPRAAGCGPRRGCGRDVFFTPP